MRRKAHFITSIVGAGSAFLAVVFSLPMPEKASQPAAPRPPLGPAIPRPPALAAASPRTDLFADYLELSQANPTETLARAMQLPPSSRESAVKAVLVAASRMDPEFVAAHLLDSGLSPIGTSQVADILVSEWKDPAKALAWSDRQLTGPLRTHTVAAALARVAQTSPATALEFLQRITCVTTREETFLTMISCWAKTNYQDALAFAKAAPGKNDFALAVSCVARTWVAQDRSSAVATVEASPNDVSLNPLAHQLALDQVQEQPVLAVTWAASLDGPVGERALRSAIFAWVSSDVASAAAFVRSLNPTTRAKTAPVLIAAWADQDPAAAALWAHTAGVTELESVVGTLVFHWYEIDPTGASSWLASLSDGAARSTGQLILTTKEEYAKGLKSPYPHEYLRLARQQLDDSGFFHNDAPSF